MIVMIAATRLAHGASVTASASCSATPPNTTTVTQSTFTPLQVVNATLTTPSLCSATASADFGILKIQSTTDSSDFQNTFSGTIASAYANFRTEFYLYDSTLPANSTINLFVPVDWSVTLVANIASGAPNLASGAAYGLSYDGVFNQVFLSTSSDVFGGNSCPAPVSTYPRCNGTYNGQTGTTWSFTVNGTGGPNSFTLWSNGRASNALMDSSNTTKIGSVILPSTMTFGYANGSAGASGNGMNFGYAAVSASAPEPSTLALSGATGLLLLLAARRRRQSI